VSDPILYARSWALDDIEILRGADGHRDGRTVKAYAAVFDTPAEIRDVHGHYIEQVDRRAFNRQIGLGIERVNVFYNHALTAMGTPSDLGSVPIGSPVEIRPDGKGLLTVTRYNRGPLADSVLEAILNGDIRGYSFRGRIFKSTPDRLPRVTRGGALPTVIRNELGLSEYGPTPNPAYAEAGILAIRAALETNTFTEAERLEILRMLASTTPQQPVEDQETSTATSTPEPGDAANQPQDPGHLRRHHLKLRFEAGLRDRGLK